MEQQNSLLGHISYAVEWNPYKLYVLAVIFLLREISYGLVILMVAEITT